MQKAMERKADMYNRENKAKSCFFLKNDKIDKPLTRLMKTKRKEIQIIDVKNERRHYYRPHGQWKYMRLLCDIC